MRRGLGQCGEKRRGEDKGERMRTKRVREMRR